jgi:hypothetical protein
MVNNSKIGAALVGGYLLGRTKKAKLAIGLGMLLAGKKLSLDPKQLGSLVADSPLLSGLSDQMRRELVDATKSAATKAVSKRIGGLADSLHERTALLERGDDDRYDDEERDDRYDDEDRDDDRDEDDDQDDDRDQKSTSGSSASGTAKSAGRSAAGRATSSARKTTSSARKTASNGRKTASGARKSTSSARKTASGAQKTASGTARRATTKGGGGND